MTPLIRIGTRTSPLAMWQAQHVAALITKKYPGANPQIVGIETRGDQDRSSPLNQIGGKGVFIREIERALINRHIDIGVHCLKDVTTHIHSDTHLSCFLPAESVSDILVSWAGYTLDTLPAGSIIGTGSMRRQALLKSIRPDLVTIPIRGNIDTRINHISNGDCAAVLLSEVSITRLGRNVPYETLPPDLFIPAPGQGVVTLQTRRSDIVATHVAQAINDPTQHRISESHLQFLSIVGFDCNTPLGIHTTVDPSTSQLRHLAFRSNATLTRTEVKAVADWIATPNLNLIALASEWQATRLSD